MSRNAVHLTVIVLLFLCLGLVFLFSASGVMAAENPRFDDPAHFLKKQGLWTVLAILAFAATVRIPYEFWEKARIPVFALAVILLALTLVPGVGMVINGARRWLHAGGWFFQPSEFAKLASAIFVCAFIAKDPARIREFRRGFLPAFAAVGLVCALIVVEPDLGTALFLGGVLATTLLVAGVRMRHVLPGAVAAVSVGAFYVATHFEHVKERLQVYFDPSHDPLGKGHQIRQSLIAFGAGGFFGEGLGRGTQKLFFLPEPQSDFIFPVIGEELGFVGAVSVLLLYGAFAAAGWRAAKAAPTRFGFLLAFTITLMVTLQAVINIAVVTACVPTKGIPLPFLSAGGSSLVFTLAAVGVLVNIANREPEAAGAPAPQAVPA